MPGGPEQQPPREGIAPLDLVHHAIPLQRAGKGDGKTFLAAAGRHEHPFERG